MSVEIKIPSVGESISTVVVGDWLVKPGQSVARETVLVVLETDKINVEVVAPEDGSVTRVLRQSGETAGIGEVLAEFQPGAAPAAVEEKREPSPAARRALAEAGLNAEQVKGTGKGGQVLKEDVLAHKTPAPAAPSSSAAVAAPVAPPVAAPVSHSGALEEVVPMSPLRKTIARRLVESQSQAALLTTFNEVDMSAAQELRKQYQDAFVARHGCKLGFMSFFIKATIEALKAFPAINAEIRDTNVVYKNYYDIGVAVGGGKGLVVPVLRAADRMSFADIEKSIKDFGQRAQAGKIKLEELQGGTFTISNGGVYGSLLSTPIVNPPQSGVLGLHKIEDRPIAHQGQVVIRPMMYLALTYDHRLVDGREAVGFLVRIKECIENPSRILLEV
jgi:2-oxoglutarate dehydrogenase E2 component (dihydrolipoamide succinyltransferase)